MARFSEDDWSKRVIEDGLDKFTDLLKQIKVSDSYLATVNYNVSIDNASALGKVGDVKKNTSLKIRGAAKVDFRLVELPNALPRDHNNRRVASFLLYCLGLSPANKAEAFAFRKEYPDIFMRLGPSRRILILGAKKQDQAPVMAHTKDGADFFLQNLRNSWRLNDYVLAVASVTLD